MSQLSKHSAVTVLHAFQLTKNKIGCASKITYTVESPTSTLIRNNPLSKYDIVEKIITTTTLIVHGPHVFRQRQKKQDCKTSQLDTR